MRCIDLKGLLDLYVDGDLPQEVRAGIDRHLLRCADCAFEVRSLEQTRAHLREAYVQAESSPAFREKMAARLERTFEDVIRTEPTQAANQRELPFPL
jgi:anti-sigma factor RsiW